MDLFTVSFSFGILNWMNSTSFKKIGPPVSAYITVVVSTPVGSRLINDIQPHILQAKASKHDADNPTFSQLMNNSHADHWWDTMETEMQTLEDDLDCWKLFERTPDMKVLPVT